MKEKYLRRLNDCKSHLTKYKTHEGEHEEGYDGHQEWTDDDKLVNDAMAFFYKAVKKRYYLEVRSFLGILLPGGPDDARLQPIQRLLTNTPSEEALKEALLLAITTGSRPLVEFILALFIDCPYMERSGCFASANFPPHITPLMLACMLNNFPVVECLLLRGHSIQIPHYLTCECSVCRRETVSTRCTQRMADVMRAISSEAFLWLATDDVVAAGCHMARDLQRLMDEDGLEQIEIYRNLEGNVQRFMAHVADQAWRAEEFNVVAANKSFAYIGHHDTPRLQLAMDSHMRQFTCSANVQTTMKSVFRRDWFNFGNKVSRDAWRLLRATLFFPLLALLHMSIPSSGTTMAVPLARCISHIYMYIVFLTAAVARPTVAYYNDWKVKDNMIAVSLEVFMYFYIFGLVIEKIVLSKQSNGRFFVFWWRWFDAFFIGSYTCAFTFFVATEQRTEKYDPVTVDRVHWIPFDPLLLHEIFLSIACVFGVSKCFYYLQLFQGIGGSIISVGKCVGKTYTYLVIMVIVILSFSVGLNVLVGPYVNRKVLKPDGTVGATTTDSYETVGVSTKNLFWSIFGYLGPSTYVTVVGNVGPEMEAAVHYWNNISMEVLGALFHGIIIITVLNLMTSLLVKKADEVLDNEEMEFKYTRAALYLEFLSWTMAAPPPLNLLLLPVHFVHRFFRRCESPSWPKEVPENDDKGVEALKLARYMNLQQTMFARFTASKECKYKSIWRTEFEKGEKHNSHVQFLTGGIRHYPIDNTYEGWRWRKARKMKLPTEQIFFKQVANNYPKKGTSRAAVLDENPQEAEIREMLGLYVAKKQKEQISGEVAVEMPKDFKGPPNLAQAPAQNTLIKRQAPPTLAQKAPAPRAPPANVPKNPKITGPNLV